LTICREWTLVKHLPEYRYARPLKCRSWSCEYCRPDRKKKLLAQAAAGHPTKFLTLTVNPAVGDSPADRLDRLANSWRIIVKRLRRAHPNEEIEYLAVVEETERGEPHLHILLRAPFIPQALISMWMRELMDSPIVDIRSVNNVRKAVAYVAKYITKAPAQFGMRKRYWMTKKWEPPFEPDTDALDVPAMPWLIDRRGMLEILTEWIHEGYAGRRDRADTIYMLRVHDPQFL